MGVISHVSRQDLSVDDCSTELVSIHSGKVFDLVSLSPRRGIHSVFPSFYSFKDPNYDLEVKKPNAREDFEPAELRLDISKQVLFFSVRWYTQNTTRVSAQGGSPRLQEAINTWRVQWYGGRYGLTVKTFLCECGGRIVIGGTSFLWGRESCHFLGSGKLSLLDFCATTSTYASLCLQRDTRSHLLLAWLVLYYFGYLGRRPLIQPRVSTLESTYLLQCVKAYSVLFVLWSCDCSDIGHHMLESKETKWFHSASFPGKGKYEDNRNRVSWRSWHLSEAVLSLFCQYIRSAILSRSSSRKVSDRHSQCCRLCLTKKSCEWVFFTTHFIRAHFNL